MLIIIKINFKNLNKNQKANIHLNVNYLLLLTN